MQDAVIDVLSTLTHRDFVYIYFAFDPASRYSNGFVRATSTSRAQISNFIWNQRFGRQQPDLSAALTDVYESFEGASFATCHRTVMLFTDTSLNQDTLAMVNSLRDTSDVSIDWFTFSFGGILLDPTVAQEIACSNGGEWFSLSDPEEIDELVHSYYKFYAASVQNSGVVWSDFFTDIFTGRNVTSACLPVYNPNTVKLAPQLLGVICLDVDPQRFNDFRDGFEVKTAPL